MLFDGICNLCNASVGFLMDRDTEAVFRFASLQSAAGQALIERCALDPETTDSIVLIEGARCYVRSAAALRIARRLPGLWPLLYGFIVIPPPLRDALYDVVAANRYRWFGKRETCRLPTLEERARFLEDAPEDAPIA